MTDSLSRGLLARCGAALFIPPGMAALLSLPREGFLGPERLPLALIAGCAIAALGCWLLPWQRWSQRRMLWIALLALALEGAVLTLEGVDASGQSLAYAVVFGWVGLALPRYTSLSLSPLLIAALVAPLLGQGSTLYEIVPVAQAVLVCLAIGESVAWVSTRLRATEGLEENHQQRLHWLVEVGAGLARIDEKREVAERVACLFRELLDGSAALVLECDPGEGRLLYNVGAVDWPENPESVRIHPDKHAVMAAALRSREAVSGAEAGTLAERLKVPSIAILPLSGSGSAFGTAIVAFESHHDLDPFTRELARSLADHAALAFERVKAAEVPFDVALQDNLTGLGNRKKAHQRLETLKAGDAVMLLDLDHFRRINDDLGRGAGDALLRELSRAMKESLRSGDEVYRYGGEKFLIVFSAIGSRVGDTGERLRKGWRSRNPATSFSAGLAVHRDAEPYEATLARADHALVAAKGAGRDVVYMPPSELQPESSGT